MTDASNDPVSDASDIERAMVVLAAALGEGDRVLGVAAAALLLAVPVGTFRQLSARPGFPAPAKMGKRLTWRKSELLNWWEDERNRQKRNRTT